MLAETQRFFWHNIGNNKKKDAWRERWWDYLVSNGQISASYEKLPGERGESVLGSYKAGDVVIAYASKCGALGWGVVEK